MKSGKQGGGHRPSIGGGHQPAVNVNPVVDLLKEQRHVRSDTPMISGKLAAVIIVICFCGMLAMVSLIR